VASSSSASKVAKLAQKGKGKKVRFQGGTVFPVVIAAVVLVFGALIVYARESRPGPGEGEPTSNQHWHAALGMYVCDEGGLQELPKLSGNLEEQDANGQYVSKEFVRTGIHSHDDGVMHWHPTSSGRATGTNAKLGVFLNNYGISLSDKKLSLPPDQSTKSTDGDVYEEGKSKCMIGGKEKKASLKLWVWDSYSKIGEAPSVYTANMGDVRIRNDGMVFQIAFVPDDVDPIAPSWSADLPTLGAADGGQTLPTDDGTQGTDTVAGSAPTSDSTVTTDSVTTDSTVTTDSVATTASSAASSSTATTGG
jgi:hypothetical protein